MDYWINPWTVTLIAKNLEHGSCDQKIKEKWRCELFYSVQFSIPWPKQSLVGFKVIVNYLLLTMFSCFLISLYVLNLMTLFDVLSWSMNLAPNFKHAYFRVNMLPSKKKIGNNDFSKCWVFLWILNVNRSMKKSPTNLLCSMYYIAKLGPIFVCKLP